MSPIVKLVRLQVANGHRDELVDALEPVRRAAEADAGTEAWAMHADRAQPHDVFIYERYRDQAAADAHDQLPALKEALRRTGPLLTAPPEVIHAQILAAAG